MKTPILHDSAEMADCSLVAFACLAQTCPGRFWQAYRRHIWMNPMIPNADNPTNHNRLVAEPPKFSRVWAMPNRDTFSIPPIGDFVKRYLTQSTISIDPFARNKQWATFTNDLNPETSAKYHMDAEVFLEMLHSLGVQADLLIFDPPYSPRQISECYKQIGREVGMKETQSALLYQRVRNVAIPLLAPGAIVLSFGWNSVGMGIKHGFEQVEILLCCHGGAHNDTICLAERKISS